METHILFFILAGILIAILIGYSVWSARREKSRVFSNAFTTRPPSTTVNHEVNVEIPDTLKPENFHTLSMDKATSEPLDIVQNQQEVQDNVNKIRISLPEQQTQVKQAIYSSEMPEAVKDEVPLKVELQPQATEELEQKTQQNIVTLYVVAPEGTHFHGSTIVQHLDALGFNFGEYQIFHRHLDNPASPVLFSVANMMQPGIFDLAKMDQFVTVGLVFFMYLPSAGNDLVNLRLMIRTVESFAQSVGGFVLDEQHQIFNEESRQNYLLRVAN